ncbi:MAG: hypothetical protein ACXABY_10010, partial [Candidatus Thorarchaeota archaeon]
MAVPALVIDVLGAPRVYAMIEDGGDMADSSSDFKFVQIGETFGSGEPISNIGFPTEQEAHGSCNSVLRVGRKIYAHVNDEIYRYDMDDPSDDWVLIYTIPDAHPTESWVKSGLYPFLINGTTCIGGFCRHSDGTLVSTFRIDTTTDIGEHLGNLFIGGTTSGDVTFATTYMWQNDIWVFQNGNIARVD